MPIYESIQQANIEKLLKALLLIIKLLLNMFNCMPMICL